MERTRERGLLLGVLGLDVVQLHQGAGHEARRHPVSLGVGIIHVGRGNPNELLLRRPPTGVRATLHPDEELVNLPLAEVVKTAPQGDDFEPLRRGRLEQPLELDSIPLRCGRTHQAPGARQDGRALVYSNRIGWRVLGHRGDPSQVVGGCVVGLRSKPRPHLKMQCME